MLDYATPVACAAAVWWFATGAILFLVRRPPRTFPWSLGSAALAAAGALLALHGVREETSAAGAYAGFICGVMLWGFLELGFLTGLIAGTRRHACPAGCGGARHFVHAIEAILHHELAIVVVGAAVLAISWDAPNAVGAWTFIVLWVMRQSAKLNLFLGVRNLGEEFLPPHLDYLKSFFRRRPINLLFPFSVTVPTIVVTLAVQAAAAPRASAFDTAGNLLIATLLTLAVLEHWLLVLPLSFDRLWRWAMRDARGHGHVDAKPAPPLGVTTKEKTC